VYSYGSYAINYPKVLNLEYILANGQTSDVTIGCIKAIGNDLFISWKYGSQYGIDKIDTTKKQTQAVFTSRKINLDREDIKDY